MESLVLFANAEAFADKIDFAESLTSDE